LRLPAYSITGVNATMAIGRILTDSSSLQTHLTVRSRSVAHA
jgi:hypothetical protein